MKNILKIVVCCLMMACESDDIHDTKICNSPDCTRYFEIWKNLLSEKNNVPISYVEKHLKPTESEIHSWADGESFRIHYIFHFEWLEAKLLSDKFIIKINEDDGKYPQIHIKKGEYLVEDEIKFLVENGYYSPYLNTIILVEKLMYDSEGEALKVVTDKEGEKNLDYFEFVIRRKGNGYPVLHAAYRVNYEENKCKSVYLNLVTGAIEEVDTRCWY